MRDLASDYLEKYAGPKKRPKSVRDDRAMLDNIVLPKLGSQKVTAVGRREIEGLHAAMQDRPYQANRVLALLSKMFNLAGQWGWRGDNPGCFIVPFSFLSPHLDRRWQPSESTAQMPQQDPRWQGQDA
jgi:hypothetical protein